MEENNVLESVASLLDDADAMLEVAGFEIDDSIEDPTDFIEQVISILDTEDMDEDIAETLCLNIAIIESLLDEDSEGEVDEASMMAKLHKSMRRSLQKRGAIKDTHLHDLLAKKEPNSVFKHYMDKKSKVLSITSHPAVAASSPSSSTSAPPKAAEAPKSDNSWMFASKRKKAIKDREKAKKASNEEVESANEDIEEVKSVLDEMSEVLEGAGYEIPEDMMADEFVAEALAIAESDRELDEETRSYLRENSQILQTEFAPVIAGIGRAAAAVGGGIARAAGAVGKAAVGAGKKVVGWAAKKVVNKVASGGDEEN